MHLHSLICAFVIHLLVSISKLATNEILNFYLVSVALQAAGDKDISILHLSCRTSDLQFSLVLQTHPANTCACPIKVYAIKDIR